MKILVVDDSIVFRTSISQALNEVPNYNVFKACSNGKIAVDILKQNTDVDLVTLDLEMPVMDGLEAIKEIRKFNKEIVIIVFSSLTTSGAEKTIDALAAGADDFLPKVQGMSTIGESLEAIRKELVPRIDALVKNRRDDVNKTETKVTQPKKNIATHVNLDLPIKPKLITIGCSTGGPDALGNIFSKIETKLSIPVLIVQHMPAMFTQKLAELLNKRNVNEIVEAREGDKIQPGYCYIAPGDYHMTLDREGIIRLNQNEKVCFVRPAVDVLLESVSQNFNGKVLNIILTGMGEDGANGTKLLAKGDNYTFIQSKESSVVWGMPGAINKLAIGAKELDLSQISELITKCSERI